MSTPLNRIYENLKNQSKVNNNQLNENELRQRAWMIRDRMMFEQSVNSTLTNTSSSSNSGGESTKKYRTIIDTIWIYPKSDLQIAIQNTSVQFTIDNNNFIFSNLNDLIDFYGEVYNRTAISQPIGNQGFSLGVGTILQGTRDRIFWRLSSGIIVIEWLLMNQITNQSDLPSGGNSPDGTVGYGVIYNDYDLDGIQDLPTDIPPNSNLDPLRFEVYLG
jgi:hypothetical protein